MIVVLTRLRSQRYSEPMAQKSKTSTRVPIDDACFELLSRTAKKANLTVNTLANLCAESFVGSLKNYGMTAPATEIKAIVAGTGKKQVSLSQKIFDDLAKIGVYLGVTVSSIMRDAILGQRFNFQRMQPVNARTMPSVRMTLFQLEQGGKQAQA